MNLGGNLMLSATYGVISNMFPNAQSYCCCYYMLTLPLTAVLQNKLSFNSEAQPYLKHPLISPQILILDSDINFW